MVTLYIWLLLNVFDTTWGGALCNGYDIEYRNEYVFELMVYVMLMGWIVREIE